MGKSNSKPAERKPPQDEKFAPTTDGENNLKCPSTDIAPDELNYDKALSAITQGKRLTLAIATLNAQADAVDKNVSSSPVDTYSKDTVVKRSAKKHHISHESNNNNRFSKFSIDSKSKSFDVSKFYHHRNFQNLQTIAQGVNENPSTNVAADKNAQGSAGVKEKKNPNNNEAKTKKSSTCCFGGGSGSKVKFGATEHKSKTSSSSSSSSSSSDEKHDETAKHAHHHDQSNVQPDHVKFSPGTKNQHPIIKRATNDDGEENKGNQNERKSYSSSGNSRQSYGSSRNSRQGEANDASGGHGQAAASGGQGGGGGGGGRKNNDSNHHHHNNHSKKKNSGRESSSSESSEEKRKSLHNKHSSAHAQQPNSRHSSNHEMNPDGNGVPPVGSIKYGSPWPGIPIVDKNDEYTQKGINVDTTQQYVPPPAPAAMNDTSSRRSSGRSQGAASGGRTSVGPPNSDGSYPLKKGRSSTLDVSVNNKFQGESIIYAGNGSRGGSVGSRDSKGYPRGGGGANGGANSDYPYYQGTYPQNGDHTFTPHGHGIPIKKQFSDHPSSVNVFVRQGGNGGYNDTGFPDAGPGDRGYGNGNNGYNDGNNGYNDGNNGYNDGNNGNDNGNNGNGSNNGNCCCPSFIPLPIPFPTPCPCPCPPPPPPPPPPPCCCRKRKPKKKKKKKDCGKQWDMMSMYGMYTLFQQMFTSWQNQMTEQYERSRPKPPPPPPPQQYAVVMANPCQAMAMMGGGCVGGGCGSPVIMMPGGGSLSAGNPGCGVNPIFEVTGVEVRGDSNNNNNHGR